MLARIEVNCSMSLVLGLSISSTICTVIGRRQLVHAILGVRKALLKGGRLQLSICCVSAMTRACVKTESCDWLTRKDGGAAAPPDMKKSARSTKPQYRLVRVDGRSVIERVRAKHWAGSLIFSLMAILFTCANFVFMKGMAVLIRHHTPTSWTWNYGTALCWLQSYLSNRSQFVIIGNSSSPYLPCTFGVPQGPFLDRYFFHSIFHLSVVSYPMTVSYNIVMLMILSSILLSLKTLSLVSIV